MTRTLATCPSCGNDLKPPIDATDEIAAAFCPHCDDPLFWPAEADMAPAVPGPFVTAEYPPLDDPTRRMPEVKGVEAPASIPCWQCREPNQIVSTNCHRCGAPIPPPAKDDDEVEERPVQSCSAPSGARARRRINVPAWLLVLLGVTLLALSGWLLVLVVT